MAILNKVIKFLYRGWLMTMFELLSLWVDLEVKRIAWLRLQQQLPKEGRMSKQMAEALITQQVKALDHQQDKILNELTTRFDFSDWNRQ
jgi:hypothetical protein